MIDLRPVERPEAETLYAIETDLLPATRAKLGDQQAGAGPPGRSGRAGMAVRYERRNWRWRAGTPLAGASTRRAW